MGKIILIIFIFFYWLYFYIQFRKRCSYFSHMVEYLTNRQKHGEEDLSLHLASALIGIQHFKDASEVLQHVLNTYEAHSVNCKRVIYLKEMVTNGHTAPQLLPIQYDIDSIMMTLDFCEHPIPGISKANNYCHNYWLNFLIVRIGRRRCNYLTNDDFIMTDALLRRK